MSSPRANSKAVWIGAALVLVALFLSTVVRVRDPDAWDARPIGGVSAVEQLQASDDVNVLFILVDTLRAERLGQYGYERDTSPFLDELAASGVRFERHLAQSSWTKASMASLWTGLYPARTGITRFDDVIPEQATMAAEPLREAGFATVGIYRNGWVAPTFGFDQGFEIYQRPPAKARPVALQRANPTLRDGATDEDIVSSAIEFLRVNGHERWFLYLHLMDLHEYVYDEESALFGSDYADSYDNSIRWTDRTLEILFKHIADMGLLDDTLVVITSDHGEAFLERGFEGHARRVYRETTEVPFILSFPFKLDRGVSVETRSRNVDVWPTVLDLLGVDAMEGVDGRSLRPEILAQLRGEPIQDDSSIAIADLDQHWSRRTAGPLHTLSVSEGPYRYVRIHVDGADAPREQLFDARVDPREFEGVASEELDALRRLRVEADAYEATEPSWGEAPTREIGELELNLLKALGYQVED